MLLLVCSMGGGRVSIPSVIPSSAQGCYLTEWIRKYVRLRCVPVYRHHLITQRVFAGGYWQFGQQALPSTAELASLSVSDCQWCDYEMASGGPESDTAMAMRTYDW